MRLIIPIVIILLGMGTGVLVCQFFKETAIGFKLSVLAGGLGAFVGLLVRDALDITAGGELLGATLAAILGAAVLAAITNVVFGREKGL